MRVHCSRRYVENSINKYVFLGQPEPRHERRNRPDSRERSSLDDVTCEVSHYQV